MKLTILVFVCTATLHLCRSSQATQGDAVPAKKFVINLDLPPKERWTEVIQTYTSELEDILMVTKAILPQALIDAVSKLGQKIENYVPYPYNQEIIGIADLLDGITTGDILLANIIYEVTAFYKGRKEEGVIACTSIVAEAVNGTLFHGRNLDYSIVKFIENMTVTLDFQKKGVTSYTGTTFAGFVGLLTGQKAYKYTISMDERDQGRLWMNAIRALSDGLHAVVSFHIRDALDREDLSYDDAVVFLADKPLIAPCYIIVGGAKPSQGAVITRDRIALTDLWRIDVFNGTWYVLETNYDRWTTPPSSDDRRDPAIKAMDRMTRANVGVQGLYNVLSTPPVLNKKTAYTVVMSAAHPEIYSTWIRYYGS